MISKSSIIEKIRLFEMIGNCETDFHWLAHVHVRIRIACHGSSKFNLFVVLDKLCVSMSLLIHKASSDSFPLELKFF